MIGEIGSEVSKENKSITLKEFLEKQREMELEAAMALPFKFDKCSAELGPVRQNLHICHNCPYIKDHKRPLAFCYSCAVTCHNFDLGQNVEDDKKDSTSIDDVFDAYGDESASSSSSHSIEEIWARRNFICDCPSTGNCKLLASLPIAFSLHQNSYHHPHNFYGRYCFCDGRGWAVGDRTMYQCEICEDWYHDICVAKDHQFHVNEEELEIPDEETFSDFICKACVQKYHNSFFSKINLSDRFFTIPHSTSASDSLKYLPSPLFLVDGWRENLRSQFDKIKVPVGLEHLLQDEEQVYEPEIDPEAKESLYDRNIQLFSVSIISFFLSLFSWFKGFRRKCPERPSHFRNKND